MTTETPIEAVRLMRELRDQIDRDVAGMTPEQRREYIRRSAERLSRDVPLPSYPGTVHPPRRHAR